MKNIPDQLEDLGEGELFRSFPDENAAASVAGQLRTSDCPSKVSPRKLASGVETEYCVYVPRSLIHRARWIMAQLPVSDDELESLAMRSNKKAD